MQTFKLEQFEGPLDLLLRLIEENQLDISQVSLAQVTEQFITELERADTLSPDELSDFLVVAAKLLYIKSKILLPHPVEDAEDVGSDLEQQLKMYRVFVEASRGINRLYGNRTFLFERDAATAITPVFVQPVGLQLNDLRDVFQHVIAGIVPIVAINEGMISRSVNIREKIEEIRTLLLEQPKVKFRTLLERVTNRTELVVTFLAMLELVKQRSITIVQDTMFSEIEITNIHSETSKNV